MKRLVALLVVAGMAAVSASAQKTKQGDRAWLFTLSGLPWLFTLIGVGGYNGGVGLLYYLSDDLGLTVGLGFGLQNWTVAPEGGADEKTSISILGFTLTPGLRFNIASSGPIVGYAGVGVSVGINNGTVDENGDKVEISSTVFGVGVALGAEWFAWSNVSLGASYSLLGFSSGKWETTRSKTTNTFSVTSISILPSGAFTLSIYW